MTILLLAAALLPALYWERRPDTADVLRRAHIDQIVVPSSLASDWNAAAPELHVITVAGETVKKAPAPGIRFQRHVASATAAPWVDGNGWRYLKDPDSFFVVDAPGKAASLAAAEAYQFGVHAAIQTDDAGLSPLASMLQFLRSLDSEHLPPLANLEYQDDGSNESAEFMNLLVRRNLLFRVSTSDRGVLPRLRLGTPEYPREEAGNPLMLAERVRDKLGDDKRLLRIFGSEVVVGRLEGDERMAKLYLLNYGAAQVPVPGLRVRVLGPYSRVTIHDYDAPNALPRDVAQDGTAIEFTLPDLNTFALIELGR